MICVKIAKNRGRVIIKGGLCEGVIRPTRTEGVPSDRRKNGFPQTVSVDF
jgi:hypothetical protein